MTRPASVSVVEVGPRDGLQNEPTILPTHSKIELIESLAETGLRRIEIGSFVSAKHVPQMADTGEVVRELKPRAGVSYSVLIANRRGLVDAILAGSKEVAVFAAASETFSQKNINCSISESLLRYRDMAAEALASDLKVRGYISCVLGCPYEGDVPPSTVARVLEGLLEIGCFEVSLGDTIGAGTPETASKLLTALITATPARKLAVHFHDTGGRALENIRIALGFGIGVVDSSIAGLGGCPFAPGAPGNVATEQVVALLHQLGIETGVDEGKLASVGQKVAQMLGKVRAGCAQVQFE